MDPVTAVGLVASVAQLIQVTLKSIEFLSGVNHASEDQPRFFQEACNVLHVLNALSRLVQSSQNETGSNGIRSLDVTNGPLDQLREALGMIIEKLQPAPGVKKIFRAAKWPFDKKQCIEILGRMERAKSSIGLVLQIDKMDILQVVRSHTAEIPDVKKRILALTSTTERQSVNEDERDKRAIIQWLSPLNFRQSHQDILSKRCAGTGGWLPESDSFREWISGSKQILWCPGMPGAGKSMLAAVALNHLDETFLSDNDIKTAGIYLDYRQATMQTFENVFAGLLAQLIECQQPLKGTVREMYKKHSGENTRPSLAEITDVIENDVRTCKAVYVVIDALDEFEDAHRMSLISQLQSLGSVVRLMITSRQIQLAQDFLAVAISLDICASDEDIRIYTQDRIRNNDRLSRFISRAADLENLIVTTVLEKARDNDNNHSSTKKAPVMFLHAKLQMDTIANKTSIKAIRKALDSLPGKLDDLYHEAMERIRQQPEDDKRLAEQTLIWVVHAYEPLRFETIQHALAVECGTQSFDPENLSDSDLILNVCAGLLTLEPESSNLRLVHYTAQDYFKSHPVLPCPHGEIVKTCVNFLSYEILRHPPPQPSWDRRWYFRNQDVSLSYLYRYVSEFWAVHAGENEDAVTDEVAKEFLVHSPEVLLGYPTTCPDFYDHNGIGLFFWSNLGLATAAFFGLNRVMEKLRPGLEDINSRGSGSFTALHLAANKAKIETMAKLISWGAEVDLLGACGSPLFQAVLTNSKPAINILLQNNANPNAQDGSHVPLIEAITRCDKQVIDALIEHGAHIDARGKYRETPLLISIREGRLEIARRLLEKGANPNINGWSCGMPPLQFASTKSEVEYTDLLLNYGAVINRRDLRSKTALHEAAYYNSLECAKLLVQNGADIEAKDEDGRTPLHWSFWRDLESRPNQVPQTMLFLLSRSNVNAADHRDHHTILHQAVLQRSRNPERRMNIIKAILDTPIDTECPSRPVITVILQYKLIDVCRRLNPDWKTSSAQWHLQENSHGPSGVLCSHPDDVTNLQTLSRLPSIKSVVYWSGGMTALDYAECLGDEVEAQVLRPRTKSTTRRLTMTIRDYLDEYHPGHDF